MHNLLPLHHSELVSRPRQKLGTSGSHRGISISRSRKLADDVPVLGNHVRLARRSRRGDRPRAVTFDPNLSSARRRGPRPRRPCSPRPHAQPASPQPLRTCVAAATKVGNHRTALRLPARRAYSSERQRDPPFPGVFAAMPLKTIGEIGVIWSPQRPVSTSFRLWFKCLGPNSARSAPS